MNLKCRRFVGADNSHGVSGCPKYFIKSSICEYQDTRCSYLIYTGVHQGEVHPQKFTSPGKMTDFFVWWLCNGYGFCTSFPCKLPRPFNDVWRTAWSSSVLADNTIHFKNLDICAGHEVIYTEWINGCGLWIAVKNVNKSMNTSEMSTVVGKVNRLYVNIN